MIDDVIFPKKKTLCHKWSTVFCEMRRSASCLDVNKTQGTMLPFWDNIGLSCPGLDTYFFVNLAVGQPSNNMDLSEVEIYLGMVIIFFLFR